MIKILSKPQIEGNFPNLIIKNLQKLTLISYLIVRNSKLPDWDQVQDKEASSYPLLFNSMLEDLAKIEWGK